MLKYYCKNCKCNYYSCSEDNTCTECGEKMERKEMDSQQISQEDKNKGDRK